MNEMDEEPELDPEEEEIFDQIMDVADNPVEELQIRVGDALHIVEGQRNREGHLIIRRLLRIDNDLENRNDNAGRRRGNIAEEPPNRLQPNFIPKNEILILPGRKRGSFRYINDQWVYYRDWRLAGVLRCAKKDSHSCKSIIKLQPDGTGLINFQHLGHRPQPYLMEEVAMVQFILQHAILMPENYKHIYILASSIYPHAAELYVTQGKCRNLVALERKANQPAVPQNTINLSQILNNYIFTRETFKGSVHAGDCCALIFIDSFMETKLRDCTSLIISNNIESVNYDLDMKYLMVVNISTGDTVYPAIYVVMQARSDVLYVAICQRLKELVPQLMENLQKIIVYPETNITNALKHEFPRTSLHLNVAHFYESICRFWVGSNLQQQPANALWKCLTLPNIPVAYWHDMFELITSDLDELLNEFPNAQHFGAFIRQNWQDKMNLLTSDNSSPKSTWLVQLSFKMVTKKLTSVEGNIYDFTEVLYNEMLRVKKKWISTEQGGSINTAGLGALRVEEKRVKDILTNHEPLGRENLLELVNAIMDNTKKHQLEESYLLQCSEQMQDDNWSGSIADAENFDPDPGTLARNNRPDQYYGPLLNMEHAYLFNRIRGGGRRRSGRGRRGQQQGDVANNEVNDIDEGDVQGQQRANIRRQRPGRPLRAQGNRAGGAGRVARGRVERPLRAGNVVRDPNRARIPRNDGAGGG